MKTNLMHYFLSLAFYLRILASSKQEVNLSLDYYCLFYYCKEILENNFKEILILGLCLLFIFFIF